MVLTKGEDVKREVAVVVALIDTEPVNVTDVDADPESRGDLDEVAHKVGETLVDLVRVGEAVMEGEAVPEREA